LVVVVDRCERFAAMLIRSGMKEEQTGEITLDDEYTTVQALIEYLYTNMIPALDGQQLCDLLKLADVYMVSVLMQEPRNEKNSN